MSEVRHVFVQLVKCVKHVHSKGMIHGDLRTLNIVRTGKSEVCPLTRCLSQMPHSSTHSFTH
jgi:serine/threonine protein kinase